MCPLSDIQFHKHSPKYMKDSKENRKGELIMKEHESDSETEGAETVRCPHVVGSSPTGGATNKPETILHLNYYLIKILLG